MKLKGKKLIEVITIVALVIALMVGCVVSNTFYLLIPLVVAVVLVGITSLIGTLLISIALTYFMKMNWL